MRDLSRIMMIDHVLFARSSGTGDSKSGYRSGTSCRLRTRPQTTLKREFDGMNYTLLEGSNFRDLRHYTRAEWWTSTKGRSNEPSDLVGAPTGIELLGLEMFKMHANVMALGFRAVNRVNQEASRHNLSGMIVPVMTNQRWNRLTSVGKL